MDLLTKIAKLLGLTEDASEDDVFIAVEAKLAGPPPPAADDSPGPISSEILAALDLEGDADLSTVVAQINVHKMSGGDDVATRLAKVEQENAAFRQRETDRTAADLVARGIAEGKLSPAQKDWATDYAAKDAKGFETYLAKATAIVAPGSTGAGAAPASAAGELTAVERQLGISQKQRDDYHTKHAS